MGSIRIQIKIGSFDTSLEVLGRQDDATGTAPPLDPPSAHTSGEISFHCRRHLRWNPFKTEAERLEDLWRSPVPLRDNRVDRGIRRSTSLTYQRRFVVWLSSVICSFVRDVSCTRRRILQFPLPSNPGKSSIDVICHASYVVSLILRITIEPSILSLLTIRQVRWGDCR